MWTKVAVDCNVLPIGTKLNGIGLASLWIFAERRMLDSTSDLAVVFDDDKVVYRGIV